MADPVTSQDIDNIGIDETYPVAGVDNDTQGFRDNFSIIKTNFDVAKTAIGNLEDNAVLKNVNNNMAGSYIIDATLKATNLAVVNKGTFSGIGEGAVLGVGDQEVNYQLGHYHAWTLSPPLEERNVTFVLVGFPPSSDSGDGGEDRYAKMRVELTPTNADGGDDAILVTFEAEKGGNIIYNSNITEIPFRLQTNEPYVYEFWSTDGGQTVFCDFVGRYRTPS